MQSALRRIAGAALFLAHVAVLAVGGSTAVPWERDERPFAPADVRSEPGTVAPALPAVSLTGRAALRLGSAEGRAERHHDICAPTPSFQAWRRGSPTARAERPIGSVLAVSHLHASLAAARAGLAAHPVTAPPDFLQI